MLHNAVEVCEDGRIIPKTVDARRTIRVLGLDSPEDVEFRSQLIGIYRLKEYDYDVFLQWMGFPEDLPDLSRKAPPSNTRPEGVKNSCHARRAQGQLPEFY
jgi:hypothetical protein